MDSSCPLLGLCGPFFLFQGSETPSPLTVTWWHLLSRSPDFESRASGSRLLNLLVSATYGTYPLPARSERVHLGFTTVSLFKSLTRVVVSVQSSVCSSVWATGPRGSAPGSLLDLKVKVFVLCPCCSWWPGNFSFKLFFPGLKARPPAGSGYPLEDPPFFSTLSSGSVHLSSCSFKGNFTLSQGA